MILFILGICTPITTDNYQATTSKLKQDFYIDQVLIF